jgi:hypothetical protein
MRLMLGFTLAFGFSFATAMTAQEQHPEGPTPPGARWAVHSWSRPRPPIVQPAPAGVPVRAPGDAIVLFDGHGLEQWMAEDSSAAKWKATAGFIECVPGTGSLISRRGFGDMQLHIEFATPTPPHGESQERGNSGVFLMGRYEIQVLDSYQNDTYPDGQAGAVYGQTPPLVNASRGPGQWQTYDIVFHRPHFNADGSVHDPARVTVLHNGVLIQDNTVITGHTVHMAIARYEAHPDRASLVLQDHANRIRYRNVWVRELE